MSDPKQLRLSLGKVHFDVLKEISNIGASHAASALATMLDRKISVGIPSVDLLEFKDCPNKVGGAESIVVGLMVGLSGDIDGIMIFLIEKESAHLMTKSMLKDYVSGDNESFSEMELSALQEIGNIMLSSYLGSLSTLTNLRINQSVPYMSIDMAGAILSVPAIQFGKVSDRVIFIESKLGDNSEDSVSGYFLLVPELQSFVVIMRSLGVV